MQMLRLTRPPQLILGVTGWILTSQSAIRALRLEAEAWCVKSLDLTFENAVDQLLYADRNHCLCLNTFLEGSSAYDI